MDGQTGCITDAWKLNGEVGGDLGCSDLEMFTKVATATRVVK
jgi:hypothetical protein